MSIQSMRIPYGFLLRNYYDEFAPKGTDLGDSVHLINYLASWNNNKISESQSY